MNYEYILFDLDGTLTESGGGILNSVRYALKSVGIEENDMSRLNKFIGPPLYDGFKTYGNFSDEKIIDLIKKYREYFSEKGIFENCLYDGVFQMLHDLKSSGKKLIVATSKPEKFTKIILNHFNIDVFFDFVFGSTLDGSVSAKEQIIAMALKQIGLTDKSTVVMVGDRFYDAVGASKNGIACIGVSYGYGTERELLEHGAIKVAKSVGELKEMLL